MRLEVMKKIMKKRIVLAVFSGLTALSLVGCYATLRADKLFYSGGVNTPAIEFVDSL